MSQETFSQDWGPVRYDCSASFVAKFGVEVLNLLALKPEERVLDFRAAWPWYFPTIEEYSNCLIKGGFKLAFIESFNRPTQLPSDIKDWFEFFYRSFFSKVSPRDMKTFMDEIRENLEEKLKNSDGIWTVAYVRLRFQAFKK